MTTWSMPPEPYRRQPAPAPPLWNNAALARQLIGTNRGLRRGLMISAWVLVGTQVVALLAALGSGSSVFMPLMFLAAFAVGVFTAWKSYRLGESMLAQVPSQVVLDANGIVVDGQLLPWGSITGARLHPDRRQNQLRVLQLDLPSGPRYLSLVEPLLTAQRQPVPVAWFIDQVRARVPLSA